MAKAPAGSLQAAIADADTHVTVLDDILNVENSAVYRWLGAHELYKGRLNNLVIGDGELPAAFVEESVPNLDSARALLARARKNPTAMAALRKLANGQGAGLTAKSPNEDTIDAVAAALVAGSLWATIPKKPAKHLVSAPSPSVADYINKLHGTQVDVNFIAAQEGNQWQRGYVPPFNQQNSGLTSGQSGMTIASGSDIGQWSDKKLEAMSFPKAMYDKLAPFTHDNMVRVLKLQHAFKGMNKTQVAAAVAKLGDVPQLDKGEADLCDQTVNEVYVREEMDGYDRSRDKAATPAFKDLPPGWQTVLVSRHYQGAHAPGFTAAVNAGRWADAVAAFPATKDAPDRIAAELRLLKAQTPPPPPPKPVPGQPRGLPLGVRP